MSFTKVISLCKDSISFTLNEADLTGMQLGQKLKTPERDVPHTNGFKWWINYYPAGTNQACENHLSVYLNVNQVVSATYTFKVDNSSIQSYSSYDFVKYTSFGPLRFASHETLRPLFVNGQLSMTCKVEFSMPMSFTSFAPRSVLYSDHVPTDFELVVDSNQVQVHKSFLSLISPVFHAMLSNDTAESRSGRLEIVDFDFETVKTAIDYCYGREMKAPAVENIFNVLRFADKYDIKAVTSLVEKMPHESLSISTFSDIIRYADDFFKNELFEECCKFFKEHQKEIVKAEKFTTLAPPLVARLLMQSFDLKTDFDVLRHAHANEITFILDPLEQPIFESLSLDTFCDTVSYAWDCSRDSLKIACAKFFNEHLTEINNMKSFVNLSPSVVQGVMKLRCENFDVLSPSVVQGVMKLSRQEPQKAEVIDTTAPEKFIIHSFICYIYYLIVETIAKLFHFN
uniref:BTB domain-containing protein n=1 Tax=Panagrellus redivivus TaxID=6233 RepID=A0A7E4ZPW7_PANRE